MATICTNSCCIRGIMLYKYYNLAKEDMPGRGAISAASTVCSLYTMAYLAKCITSPFMALLAVLVVVGCNTTLWHSFLVGYIFSRCGRSSASLVTAMLDCINGDCRGSNYGCGLGRLDLVCYCYYGGGGLSVNSVKA